MSDESAENRKTTVRALVRFHCGLDPWIPRLLQIAEHDEGQAARAATVQDLGDLIGPPGATAAAVPTLTEALKSRDLRVRAAVARSLYRFGPEAAPAIPALLRVFTEPIDGERGSAGAGSANDGMALTAAAAWTLGEIAPGSTAAPEVITALTEVVRSSQGPRQANAAWALGEFGPAVAPAIPALVEMARQAGPLPGNDDAAARALGQIAPGMSAANEAVVALEHVLQSRQAHPASRRSKRSNGSGPMPRPASPSSGHSARTRTSKSSRPSNAHSPCWVTRGSRREFVAMHAR